MVACFRTNMLTADWSDVLATMVAVATRVARCDRLISGHKDLNIGVVYGFRTSLSNSFVRHRDFSTSVSTSADGDGRHKRDRPRRLRHCWDDSVESDAALIARNYTICRHRDPNDTHKEIATAAARAADGLCEKPWNARRRSRAMVKAVDSQASQQVCINYAGSGVHSRTLATMESSAASSTTARLSAGWTIYERLPRRRGPLAADVAWGTGDRRLARSLHRLGHWLNGPIFEVTHDERSSEGQTTSRGVDRRYRRFERVSLPLSTGHCDVRSDSIRE